ncbi:MAG: bifunctional UDP-4-keto-pentose/UDP-xylose synthase [Chitinispirillaceae bacterium]
MSVHHKNGRSLCLLGCGGFIGSHLVERLLQTTDYHLIGIDISSAKIQPFLEHERFEFSCLDVHESGLVSNAIARADTVVSLVALCNPAQYNSIPLKVIDIDYIRSLQVVQMCARMDKRLIQFSSCEVYGKTLSSFLPPDSPLRDDPAYYLLKEDESPLLLGPVNAQRWSYAASKQLLERSVYAYGFEQNLDYTIIRPFNFIGPRMDYIPGIDGDGTPRVLACFMDALLNGKPLKLVDGGQNRRCFTFIDDAIDAIVRILERPRECRGQIFNIGNPQNEVSIAQLAGRMIEIYQQITADKGDIVVEDVSGVDFYGSGYQDSDRRVPDISKAQKLLDWCPQIDLAAALRKTVDYYVRAYGREEH